MCNVSVKNHLYGSRVFLSHKGKGHSTSAQPQTLLPQQQATLLTFFGKLHKSRDAGLLGKSEQECVDGAQNKHSCHSALAMFWAMWRIERGLCFSWSKWWKYSELLDGLEKPGMCKMESRFKKTMYFMSRSGSKTADCLFQPGFYMWS